MNLLPTRYRERSLSQARSSRVAIAAIVALGAAVALATHARLSSTSSQSRLIAAQVRADGARAVETRATRLELAKIRLERFVDSYRREELPLPMGDLLATIAGVLPPSVTVEELRLELVEDDGTRRIDARLEGFARSDVEVTELVERLAKREPFTGVTMDFSRSRSVRAATARGFRIGFHVNLDGAWKIAATEEGKARP